VSVGADADEAVLVDGGEEGDDIAVELGEFGDFVDEDGRDCAIGDVGATEVVIFED